MSVVHTRLVFEYNHAVLCVSAKNSFQLPHHGSIAGMTFKRGIRRREQSASRALIVELLLHAENAVMGKRGREELVNDRSRPFMPHFFVVRAVDQQKLLVLPQKRRAFG